MNVQDKTRKQIYLRIKQLMPHESNKAIRTAVEKELQSGYWDDKSQTPNAHKEEEVVRLEEAIIKTFVQVLQESHDDKYPELTRILEKNAPDWRERIGEKYRQRLDSGDLSPEDLVFEEEDVADLLNMIGAPGMSICKVGRYKAFNRPLTDAGSPTELESKLITNKYGDKYREVKWRGIDVNQLKWWAQEKLDQLGDELSDNKLEPF